MAQYDDTAEKAMWFMIGALVGAGVALLYAPASGEDTRKAIGDKARRGKDVLADRGHDLMDRGRDLYERGLKMADEAADMFEQGRKLVGG
jgi:gas vesicle protein